MAQYFIFIIIPSTVYKELDTLMLIDRVKAKNTKEALMKAEENQPSNLHAGVDNSKMIAWNCNRADVNLNSTNINPKIRRISSR